MDKAMTVTELKHAAKRQEWREKIMECRNSGEPVRKWCGQRQVSVSTYYRWEREIFGGIQKEGDNGQALAVAAPEFTEVSGIEQSGGTGRTVMTVRMGRLAVDIYAGAQEEELRAMCRVLKLC